MTNHPHPLPRFARSARPVGRHHGRAASVVAGGLTLTASLAAGVLNASTAHAATNPGGPVATQAAAAAAALAINIRAPHPGVVEAVTHPDSDSLGSSAGGAGAVSASSVLSSTTVHAASGAVSAAASPTGILGTDTSSFQGNVDWTAASAAGEHFAYVKATEGTYYTESAYFAQQYNGSLAAGMIRGAYHFAIPSNSTGTAQADYFVAHGGGWTADGHTLPGMLDLEFNPYGAECYGMSGTQLAGWVVAFDNEYQRLTGRWPVLYTNTNWWNACIGDGPSDYQAVAEIAADDTLAIANYGRSPSPLPAGFPAYSIWQYTDSNQFGRDGDAFNGSLAALSALAIGSSAPPTQVAATPTSNPAGSRDTLPGAHTMSPPSMLQSTGGAYRMVMQNDGNLVVYSASGQPLWATLTQNNPGAWLAMQNDGNLVVYSSSGRPLWASHT